MDSVASPELEGFQHALEEITKQFKEGDTATITKMELQELLFKTIDAFDKDKRAVYDLIRQIDE